MLSIQGGTYIQYLFAKIRKTYKLHPEETFIYKTNQSFKIHKFVQKEKLKRTKRKNYDLKNSRETVVAQINGRNSQRCRIDFFG